MNKTDKKIMVDNNNNEGIVNNSNEPSQNNELKRMIEKKISDLTEQLGVIGNEIQELKTIEVSDEIKKIVVGSTEFNIEDFMKEPDIKVYRNWLKIKKELEEKEQHELDNLIEREDEKDWENHFQDYISSNYGWSDLDYIDDLYDFGSFVYDRITDPDDYSIESFKDDFMNDKLGSETLSNYIENSLEV